MFQDPLLDALAAVARHGSFERAAAQLGLTPPAVSLRIRALEDRVGARVLQRGQPCRPTATGARLIRHHAELALLSRALAEDLPSLGGPPATLRLALNADSLATWVIPALAAVEGLLYDIVIADQDHALDRLRSGEVSAALASRAEALQGCDAVPLGALRFRATASPAFVARWMPGGPDARALAQAPALEFSAEDGLQAQWAARIAGRPVALRAHRLASTHGFVDAVLAGLGWAMNPEPLVAAHLAAGRLVELVPDTPLDTPLHWHVARIAAPALAPLTAALRRAAAASLVPPAGGAASRAARSARPEPA